MATKIVHQKNSVTGSQKYGKMGHTNSKKAAANSTQLNSTPLNSTQPVVARGVVLTGPVVAPRDQSRLEKCHKSMKDIGISASLAESFTTEAQCEYVLQKAQRRLEKCHKSLRDIGVSASLAASYTTEAQCEDALQATRLERSKDPKLTSLQKCNTVDQLLGGLGTFESYEECAQAIKRRDRSQMREQARIMHRRQENAEPHTVKI